MEDNSGLHPLEKGIYIYIYIFLQTESPLYLKLESKSLQQCLVMYRHIQGSTGKERRLSVMFLFDHYETL